MSTLFDGLVPVHYRFVYLMTSVDAADAGDWPDPPATTKGQANGLCGASVPGCLSFVTGLHTGDVPFVVEWSSSEPDIGEGWEDVVEVPFTPAGANAALMAFQDTYPMVLPSTGSLRARYCAAGMDAGADMDCPDPDEHAPDRYLVQLWPAPVGPERVMSQVSEQAAYWNRTAQESAVQASSVHR